MIQLSSSIASKLKQLTQMHHDQRLPHALLFQTEGGGAGLPLALELARFIHCTSAVKTNEACGECASCHKYRQLVHPDLYLTFPVIGAKEESDMHLEGFRKAIATMPYMDVNSWLEMEFGDENKQGNINRAESRRIITRLGLKPFESDTKIQLIWMPELLGDVGNALLKIIEEPPHKTFFLLVCNQTDRILGTILSRTQKMIVPAIPADEIKDVLVQNNCPEDQAEQIAFLCQGNMHRALGMVAENHEDYTGLIRDWMRSCYALNTAGIQAWVNQTAGMGREKLKNLLGHGLQIFRESLRILSIPNYQPRINAEHRDFVIKFSNTLDSQVVEAIYRDINQAIYHIERNANAKICLLELSLSIKNHFRTKQLSRKAS